MINIVLAVLVSALVTLGFIYMGYWITHWRSAYQEVCGVAENLMVKFEQAEDEKIRAQSDLKVFKDYLGIIASRTVMAQLTEEQVAHIAQHIASSLTPKGEMN